MINENEQTILSEIDKKFTQPNAQIAFNHLFKYSRKDKSFRCVLARKGKGYHVKLLHYDGDSTTYRYSFIVNKGSILWYFRKPALAKFKYELERLNLEFGAKNVKINPSGEITIKIYDLGMAEKLVPNYLR